MARYRMVHTEFWSDPLVVEEMTPEDRYFFLYLLTNPNTTQIGIYQITKKQMAFEMGYSMETINSLLDRFINHHKLIRYNPETREIAIKNWGKYNLNRGGKPVIDCVVSELKDVKDTSLIEYVGKNVKNNSIKALYDTYYDTSDDSQNDTYNESYNDTYTISTQKEKEKEKEKEKHDVSEIIKFWDENGFGVNNIHGKNQLLSWLDDSPFPKPKEMILKALSIACSRNKRNFAYVEGILRNWVNDSTLTIEEVESNQMKRGENSEVNAPNYELTSDQNGNVRLFK